MKGFGWLLMGAMVFAIACGGGETDAVDGADDGFLKAGKVDVPGLAADITDGDPMALAILSIVNDQRADFGDFLKKTVGLPSGSSDRIVDYRAGYDGVYGTEDDLTFYTLASLDGVPYVGPICFRTLVDYVTKNKLDVPFTSTCDKDADCTAEGMTWCTEARHWTWSVYQCGPVRSEAADAAQPAFEDMVMLFLAAFQTKDVEALAQFVHPEHGFFLITNPGAYTIAVRFTKIEEATRWYGSEETLLSGGLVCDPKPGVLPWFSCERYDWTKTGCFYNTTFNAHISTTANLNPEMYDFEPTETTAAEKAMADALDAATTHGLYSTESNLGFFFGFVDGQWILTAIEAISWCDA